MSEIKSPKTYEEQVEKLKQYGCIISDEDACKQILASVNYYRLSAYFLPFKVKEGLYRKGTTFKRIYHIYEFDRKLRNILFAVLEVIEISLRARLAYLHGHKYGALGYQDSENFNNKHNKNKFQELIETEISRNQKLPFVKHHLEKYHGNFPVWVIIELFGFGMASYFYADLHTTDKKEIAKQYKVNYRNLESWLRCLTDLRNICAHHGRLYYMIFSSSPSGLNISESAKRRLWGLMLVLKSVYPSRSRWQLEVLPKLESLFSNYSAHINLDHLAFPKDWFHQLNI